MPTDVPAAGRMSFAYPTDKALLVVERQVDDRCANAAQADEAGGRQLFAGKIGEHGVKRLSGVPLLNSPN